MTFPFDVPDSSSQYRQLPGLFQPRPTMDVRHASLIHVILLHIECRPELLKGVEDSAGIENLAFVIKELQAAIAEQMVGPVR